MILVILPYALLISEAVLVIAADLEPRELLGYDHVSYSSLLLASRLSTVTVSHMRVNTSKFEGSYGGIQYKALDNGATIAVQGIIDPPLSCDPRLSKQVSKRV